MITYKFIAGDGTDSFAEFTEIKAMSLKKALRSFQTKAGDLHAVVVEWKSRKGNISYYHYKLPYKTRKERKGKL
jgi:hypothetical protein